MKKSAESSHKGEAANCISLQQECARARGRGLVVDVLKVSHSWMTSCATPTTLKALCYTC